MFIPVISFYSKEILLIGVSNISLNKKKLIFFISPTGRKYFTREFVLNDFKTLTEAEKVCFYNQLNW